MRRLAVSLCALVLSLSTALLTPGSLSAAPPPCPAGDTFQYCLTGCPLDLALFCFQAAGRPANCQLTESSCDYWGTLPCDGSSTEGQNWWMAYCHWENA